MRKTFRQLLADLTKLILRKHRPTVIAVTGTGANAVARDLIFQVINIRYPAVQSLEAPVAEFSIPLTVFGASGYPDNRWQWFKVIVKALLQWIKLPSYKHFMVIEVDTVDKQITDFWLDVLQPAEIVETEAAKEPKLEDYRELALQVGEKFDVDTEIAASILEFYEPEHARISLRKGVNDSLVVDATYHFYPAPLQVVAETVVDNKSGDEVFVVNPSEKDLELREKFPKWQFLGGSGDEDIERGSLGRKSTIILRGFAPVAQRKFEYIFEGF